MRGDRGIALGIALGVIILVLTLGGLVGTPLNDDFSYARTAEALATTGRVAYNGWGSPLLLTQALLGALVIRVGGFSYLNLHALGLLAASGSASGIYLLARRCALSQGLSGALTAQIALCPIFLGVAPTFLTDLFSTVLLLGCVLVLSQALVADEYDAVTGLRRGPFVAAVVLGIAAIANRQLMLVAVATPFALLALLVPAVRKPMLLAAAALGVVGLALIRWGNAQPYLVFNDPDGVAWAKLFPIPSFLMVHRFFRMLGLFLLPWTLPALVGQKLRWLLLVALGLIWFVPYLVPLAADDPQLYAWGPSFWLSGYGQYLTGTGILVGGVDGFAQRSSLLAPPLPALLLLLGALGGLGSGYLLATAGERRQKKSWTVAQLTAWCAAASALTQLVAMLPWLAQRFVFDRYYLPVLPGLLIFHATQLPAALPRWGKALPVIGAVLSALCGIVFATEYYGLTRTRHALYQELRQQGVAPERIDAGVEQNGDTQLLREGHVNDKRIENPPGAYQAERRGSNIAFVGDRFPALHAAYRLSTDPHPSDPLLNQPATRSHSYTSLLPPFTRTIYVYSLVGESESK